VASDKQTIWLTEYLKCFNATEAARRAGYKSPDKQGQEVKAKFADEIKAHIDELVMSADEALILLSEQARASLGDFAAVQVLADLENHPKARLVKSLASDVYEDKAGKVHYKARIELHDSQAAILNVLKIHGKFTEKVEHSADEKLLKWLGDLNGKEAAE
jgi:phage terminase small subunit